MNFSPLFFLCMDVCVVQTVRLAQLSPLLLPHPLITLWGGSLLRAGLHLFLTFTFPGSPLWMSSFEGLQSMGVLCFHCPIYISLLWACAQSILGQLWGWHSWQGLLQGYCVTVVAWLYWTRYVPSLLTKPTKEPQKKTGASLEKLMGYMKPYIIRFGAVLSLVVISSLGEMAIPHYTGRMTDWIMNEDEPEAFTYAITVMSLITVMSAVCEFVCDLIYNITMSRIHTSIQGLVFQSVLKQEIAFFDKAQTGDLVSRITTDINDMSESLSKKLSLLMWYFMRVTFLFIFMLNLSWKLSLFTAMGLPIIWVIPKISGKWFQELGAKVQKSLAQANDVATETFSSMKTVRSFANEEGETERYRKRLEKTYSLNKEEAVACAASTWTNSMSSLFLKVSILYYGGSLVTGGTVSSGNLVAFVIYELQLSSAVEGLSLELRPGQITALVGASGAGKSTCVSLLERFYLPQEGEILLDGQPLNSYKNQYLHDQISVVSQEPVLFARSVKENIKYGRDDATDEEMYQAAELANAHKFISDLPNVYDTDAGEKGGQVSGGQKQRIAIARALIRQPRILVLDDATSNLDTESEHLVHQALLNNSIPCSVLLIAHKLSTVAKANHIVVLEEGKVLEEGSHVALLEKGGTYADLVNKQNTGFQRKEGEELNN
ncbi:antigen peptide transporter 1-like isoform X2 [Salvelinus alpinus]|uniref:antigen peptide transporter 1-like isoform X2 n=1 Tax=Salvelinus alpinus TaxID=8036 RepID=UPI0039FB8D00